MRFKAVIFDMDGTLVDSLSAIHTCMNKVLEMFGYSPRPIEEYRNGIGSGVRNLMRFLLKNEDAGEEKISRIMDVYLPIYAGPQAMELTIPYIGVPELLEKLHENGIRTGVLTNKDHKAALGVVRECLGGFAFDAVRGFIDGRPNKPDYRCALETAQIMGVPPRDILFAGDSDVDMITAKRAGMTPAGVSWGYRSRTELIQNGAVYIIDEPPGLLSVALGEYEL